MLRKVVRFAEITKAAVSGLQFAVQQVRYRGKSGDSAMIFPYGLHANVPPGTLGLMFTLAGSNDNRATIPTSIKVRPELQPGEVALHHPSTESLIVWRQGGKLEVTAVGDVTINAPNATLNVGALNVTGTMTVDGFAQLKAGASLGEGGQAIARVGDDVNLTTGKIISGSGISTAQ